jgi:hypothetical protein
MDPRVRELTKLAIDLTTSSYCGFEVGQRERPGLDEYGNPRAELRCRVAMWLIVLHKNLPFIISGPKLTFLFTEAERVSTNV